MSQLSKEQLEDVMRMDPHEVYDPAILGVAYRSGERIAIYSKRKIIEILVADEQLTEEEALEHFEFNIAGTGGAEFPMYMEDDGDYE